MTDRLEARRTERSSWFNLPLEQHQLANGLRVLLHPDPFLPIVAVNVWYHAGSKNDRPDRTGLAHLFEHLMFEGSAGYDDEYSKPLQAVGGAVNGSTNSDRTNYYEVVPSGCLELALWLEADRMGHLLPALSEAKLENQRQVVLNERRQRVENQPYGRVSELIAQHRYPKGHPYSWPVIGWTEHLLEASMEDVRGFFTHHYHPNNATLAIAGDFDIDEARRWIDRYFGPIAASSAPPAPFVPPPINAPRRLWLEDAVSLPRLDWIWRTPPAQHADEPALDLLSQVLGGRSRDCRLKRRLIHDERLMNTVGASHHSIKLEGQFTIRGYALEGTSLEAVEESVRDSVDEIRKRPPTREELDAVRHDFLNQAYSRIETVLGRADDLSSFLFYEGHVHGDSLAQELARYERVSEEDLCRVAESYLSSEPLIVTVKPSATREARTATVTATLPVPVAADKSHRGGASALPKSRGGGTFRPPRLERATLPNGLRLIVASKPSLPRWDAQLLLPGGSVFDPPGRFGLSRLTSEMIDEGTERRDGLELTRQLDHLGASLSAYSGIESGGLALRCLSATREEAFALFAEVARQPRWNEDDLERERSRLLAELAHRAELPAVMANEAFDDAVFPNHPYGRPSEGTREGVRSLSSADLAAFHQRHFQPAGADLLIVGDTCLEAAAPLVEKYFGDWRSTSEPPTAPTASAELSMAMAPGPTVRLIPRPGSAQTVLRIGRLAPARSTPDYHALLLLNSILGGQFSSRLNLLLREEKGLTYGIKSSFHLRRHGGSFVISTDVDRQGSGDAVREILRSIVELGGARRVTPEERLFSLSYLSGRFPSRFESAGGVLGHIAQIVLYDLPDDYYDHFLGSLAAVDHADLDRCCDEHLSLNAFHIIAVADPSTFPSIEDAVSQIVGRG